MNSIVAVVLGILLSAQAPGTVDIRDVAPELHPTVSAVFRVLDQQGRAVPGLGRADFALSEDGKPVSDFEVRASFRDGGSLAVVLLVDTSFSMLGAPLEGAKAAARAFLDRLGPDDRVALVTFGAPAVDQAGFGPPSAITSIDGLRAAGYTALYDAVNLGVAKLSAQSAKARAVIVLTDGGDDGSSLSFDQVRQVVGSAGLPIHGVGFQSPEFSAPPMQQLAAVSGGSYRETADPDQLATLYRQIADELVAEYRITYRSTVSAGRHTLGIVAQPSSAQLSGERSFDIVATQPPAAGPGSRSAPASVAEPRTRSLPVLPFVLACAVAVVALVGATTLRARRSRARPVVPVPRAASPAVTPNGLVLEGPGIAIPLNAGPLLVGRDPASQVIIDDPSVSRLHARLNIRPDGLWVEDLGSSNGTLINGVRVESALMQSGDVLDIGDLHLVLRQEPA